MDADGASASCVESASASASALSSSYKTYKDYMRAMLPNGDQWPLAMLDGDQLPTLMDAEEIDGDEASWEQYLLEMKAYRKYMRARLPKAEQETHGKYNFALAELKENDDLDEFDKARAQASYMPAAAELHNGNRGRASCMCAANATLRDKETPPDPRAPGSCLCATTLSAPGAKRHNRTLGPSRQTLGPQAPA